MNRRKALTAALFSLSLIAPTAMMAQYPQLNADARKTYDVLMSTARAHSDSAWAVAKPIVDKEAREGRPYVPWASRPDEKPRARTDGPHVLPCQRWVWQPPMPSRSGRVRLT